MWVFLYGMMSGVGFQDLFGNFGPQATVLLSFVISMYAARQLFGFFLLDMFGYGAWALAGVFGAAFFVLALRRIFDKWYKIEEYGAEMRGAIEAAIATQKEAKKALYKYVESCKKSYEKSDDWHALVDALMRMLDSNTPEGMIFLKLGPLRAELETLIRNTWRNPKENMERILNLLKT